MGKLLALTGDPGAGKTTVAERLADQHGFRRISGSDILRSSVAALTEEEKPQLTTRAEWDSYHREWRKKNGIDAMGSIVLELAKADPAAKLCFENVRNYADSLTLKKGGGTVVALRCDFHTRLARAAARKRQADVSLETFRREEENEYDSPDPFGSHVHAIMREADITIDAEGTVEETMQKLTEALRQRGILL